MRDSDQGTRSRLRSRGRPREAFVEYQGHAHAHQGGLGHEGAHEVQRAPESVPVERVGEDLDVVAPADPAEERHA